jgi:hypothetical protein
LNGKYKTMNGIAALTYYRRDETSEFMVSIYCDGVKKYQSAYITTGVMPIPVSLNVQNVQQIKFVVDLVRGGGAGGAILLDMTFKR